MERPWEALDQDDREDFEERAAILEFDGGMSRDEANARAWEIISARLCEEEANDARW